MSKLDHEMTDEEWKEELKKRIPLESSGDWDGWYKKLENDQVKVCVESFHRFVIPESQLSAIVFMINDMHEEEW